MPMGEASRQRKEARFVPWYLQAIIYVPSPWPPPWNQSIPEFGDSRIVKGMFRQDQSKETLIAAAQGTVTRGRFATAINENLKPGDVLRDENRVFIRLASESLDASVNAAVQIKTYQAYETERGKEEHEARQLAGAGG